MKKEVYERLLQEKEELSERHDKLGGFRFSDKFEELSEANQILLCEQDDVMREYLRILKVRIELNAPDEVAAEQ